MRLFTALMVVLVAGTASADVIRLKNGGTLEGVILREAEGSLVVRLKYATVTVDRIDIDSIQKTAPPEGPQAKPIRLAHWEKCLEVIAARPWAGELRQIPATVVDKGILKNVPYMSHQSSNFEFNLYGDPDAPACLEIGITKDLRRNDAAKKECLDVICALLGDPADVALVRTLALAIDKKERDGVTFEVTPETAEDAYDGWWISVYDRKALEAARATDEELRAITIDEEELRREEEAAKKSDPRKTDPRKTSEPARTSQEALYLWQSHDLRYARPVPTGRVRRVYLRGYSRPGGRYVHPGHHR
ncbi:MAG TPA: hypothetical protein VMU54_11810 [Planctomycetota bacterium]|nr:hypothetical protein [Planctomycetota bacterium]